MVIGRGGLVQAEESGAEAQHEPAFRETGAPLKRECKSEQKEQLLI
jgi:hypothetical protein